MKLLQTIPQAVQSGDWMLSVDLQDAHLHIPNLRFFQIYLRFASNQIHLQFQSLPFRLCTSLWVFTNVLIAVLAPLREKGLGVYHYPDNILLLAKNQVHLGEHKEILLSTLEEFGWLVNQEKSWVASTQIIHLEALFNTSKESASLVYHLRKCQPSSRRWRRWEHGQSCQHRIAWAK